MTMMQSNLAIIQNLPEDKQRDVYNYLVMNYVKDSPFFPLSANQIKEELAQSRKDAEDGMYMDFDAFLDGLEKKYEL